jgi:hypothetical protein
MAKEPKLTLMDEVHVKFYVQAAELSDDELQEVRDEMLSLAWKKDLLEAAQRLKNSYHGLRNVVIEVEF